MSAKSRIFNCESVMVVIFKKHNNPYVFGPYATKANILSAKTQHFMCYQYKSIFKSMIILVIFLLCHNIVTNWVLNVETN